MKSIWKSHCKSIASEKIYKQYRNESNFLLKYAEKKQKDMADYEKCDEQKENLEGAR